MVPRRTVKLKEIMTHSSPQSIDLGRCRIGNGEPCFVIAEAGVNHNGDIELAHRLIDVAGDAGASAVKFQTFRADDLARPDTPKSAYQTTATGSGENQFEMLKKLELPREVHLELMDHAAARDLVFLSTPFEEGSADFLYEQGVAAFKIPSGEVTNLPFLRHVTAKGRPIILSTGGSTMDEVGAAVESIGQEGGAGQSNLVLLHCVSTYPANPAEANLRAMSALSDAFGTFVGWSDHTPGIAVALAAAALGAVVIEKHVTLDREMPGPDHAASLSPEEMSDLVAGIRTVEAALGDGQKIPSDGELEVMSVVRKSLAAARDLGAGTVLSTKDVMAVRPGSGIPPSETELILGRRLRRSLARGELLDLDMFET